MGKTLLKEVKGRTLFHAEEGKRLVFSDSLQNFGAVHGGVVIGGYERILVSPDGKFATA